MCHLIGYIICPHIIIISPSLSSSLYEILMFHGEPTVFSRRYLQSPNMCHGQNLWFFFCSVFFFFSGGHQSITKSLASAGLDHGTYENSDCSPWGVSINVVTSKCLVFISWKIPYLEMDADRGTPTSESSISSIIPPPFFLMHARFVPVISGYYMVIIWLLYGYYMVIIWFMIIIIWLVVQCAHLEKWWS